jgi:hypothetical protein
MAASAEKVVKEYPRERFDVVAEEEGIPEDATRLLMGMMDLAMSRRLTTGEVLGHEAWGGGWRVEEGS